MRGAFRCKQALQGVVVAVLEHVMSTGATLEERARRLKQAGAVRVFNWVLARALAPQYN